MSMLPVFLKLDGRRCLLVGAGGVALDKIGSLLKTGVRLRVVAPEALPEIQQLAHKGSLEWVEREFEPSDLDGNALVIAATDSPEVNAHVHWGAAERGILSNSVDDIPNCDFFFGSVVSRGDLQIAISTGGQSPAVAQQLRREIDEQLPAEIGPWLENLGRLRREVLAAYPSGEARKLLLHRLAQLPVCDSESCPARQLAFGALEEERRGDEDTAVTDPEFAESLNLSNPLQAEIEARNDIPTETVYLVGAGPGDPELLTVKALRLIQTADVILHDDLVPQAILDQASPSAEVRNVGKRCGTKSINQEEINLLMVEHAHAGRSVVRLKVGDPLIFGRASEEIAALAEAGVLFQVVPGVTAACAASAAIGCSLTSRNGASKVVFSTGHRARIEDGGNREPLPEPEDATRIVYMPGRDLHRLAQEWLQEGLPPELPCAVIPRAAQPDQQIRRTTLGKLGDAEPTQAPSLIIGGWAVRESATGIRPATHCVPATV
jgi:uroporphyrin-III C-methyltransferase/precorrin-2 dehydrogenase/sirohydrochlorin ferrochelatase